MMDLLDRADFCGILVLTFKSGPREASKGGKMVDLKNCWLKRLPETGDGLFFIYPGYVAGIFYG